MNEGKQMTDVWRLPAIAPWEKTCTKHPTQKPLALLTRIILASTRPDDWILDPFSGSSTTGVASNLFGRRFLGIDCDTGYLDISQARKLEIECVSTADIYRKKINKTLGGSIQTEDDGNEKVVNLDCVNEFFSEYVRQRELPF